MVWYFDFPYFPVRSIAWWQERENDRGNWCWPVSLMKVWNSGINILPQNKRPTTTAPILLWVTYCMCCCWSRIFIKAQSIPLWTPWLMGWWVHCLIIALSPQDFLSKYYRRKSGHFTPWGSHIAVLQRGEEEISFLARKGIEPWSPFKKTPQTWRVTPLNTRTLLHSSHHTLQL